MNFNQIFIIFISIYFISLSEEKYESVEDSIEPKSIEKINNASCFIWTTWRKVIQKVQIVRGWMWMVCIDWQQINSK